MRRELVRHSKWRSEAAGIFPVNPILEKMKHPMILDSRAPVSRHPDVAENIDRTSKVVCSEKTCQSVAVLQVGTRVVCARCAARFS